MRGGRRSRRDPKSGPAGAAPAADSQPGSAAPQASADEAEAEGTAATSAGDAADLTPELADDAEPGLTGEETDEQLSLDGLDEPAEVLVHISTEALEGEGELIETVPPEPATQPGVVSVIDDPVVQIRLARVHLRTGSLAMARAELETLAGRGQLDRGALLDLAEVRWRTGDLHGAGEAAVSYLDEGGDDVLGFVIAAEAAALSNRLDEARRHAEKALERRTAELDPIFAGMPRKAILSLPGWNAEVRLEPPVEPPVAVAPAADLPLAAEVPVAAEVAAAAVEPAAPSGPGAPTGAPALESIAAGPETVAPGPEGTMPAPESSAPATGSVEPDVRSVEAAQAATEIEYGRVALDSGDPMMAALRFGVAIRIAPASARAVLDAVGDRQDLPLQLVRGDALRLLGLDRDAGQAYLSVANALGGPQPVPTESSAEPELPPAEPAPTEPSKAPEPPTSIAEPAAPEPGPVVPEPEPPEARPIRWD